MRNITLLSTHKGRKLFNLCGETDVGLAWQIVTWQTHNNTTKSKAHIIGQGPLRTTKSQENRNRVP